MAKLGLFILLVPAALLASQFLSVWFFAKVALVSYGCYIWRLHKESYA